MSYDRPNKIEVTRGRRLTVRRVVEMWPLLIWLLAVWAAFLAYQKGVNFSRMNGVVDVYQVSISPPEDSRFESLGPNIARSVRVKKGDVIAVMVSDEVQQKIEAMEAKLASERLDELLKTREELAKLNLEIAKINSERLGASAERDSLRDYIDSRVKPLMKGGKTYEGALQDVSSALPELAKIYASTKRMDAEVGVGAVKGALAVTLEALEASKAIQTHQLQDLLETEGNPLEFARRFHRADELAVHDTLKRRKDLLTLVAPHSGTVDRIEKEAGEYVKAGEAIVRIVGDPEMIICLLPQEQLARVQPGNKVWITPTSEVGRKWQSEVISLAPRTVALPDSTSPMPNRRVFVRDVLVKYPDACKDLSDPLHPKFQLLPGQTLIINLEEPGSIPLFNRIFHNDDK